MTESSSSVYDVIIVGAGPAGSAAAINLVQKNHSVLIIDKSDFPRDKICGDGITGDSINTLKELGVWELIRSQAHENAYVELFPEADRSFILNNSVFTLKRQRLDNILLDYALKCGAEFKQCEFTGNRKDSNTSAVLEVECQDSKEIIEIKAKYVIYAMGCQYTKHLKNLKYKDFKKPDLIAVRGYYKAEWNIDHPLVFFNDGLNWDDNLGNAYFWVFPMGNGEFNVGCGCASYQQIDFKSVLNKFMANNKMLNDTTGYWVSPVKGAFLRTDISNIKYAASNNTLLVGDFLGTTFPFTGEGIGKALETGVMASKIIHKALVLKGSYSLQEYRKSLGKPFKLKYYPYRLANSFCKKKTSRKMFFGMLLNSKKICSGASKVLSEQITPTKMFLPKGIMAYLLNKIKSK